MSTVTISKRDIGKQRGVVVLPVKEYRRLLMRAMPTFYLSGKEAEKLDQLVADGIKEHRAGRSIRAVSLKDALKIYGKKNSR